MSQIKAIISDADGTLVNTLYLIRHGQYEAAVEYLIRRDIPKTDIPNYEIYESFINKSVGGSTKETFEKTLGLLFGQSHAHHLQKIDYAELNASLDPIQDHIAPLYVHPFYGLTELLNWVGQNGMNFGIFTSGNRRMIMRNFGVSLPVLGYTDLFRLEEIDVTERFNSFIARAQAVFGLSKLSIVTCEEVAKTKPNPEGILKILSSLSVTHDEVIVLGDHPVDMQAARAAGLHSIGITHGFGTPAELKEAGALKVINNLGTLPRILNNHNSGKELLF